MALAPVGVERPADHDAALTLGRQPVDPGRHPREQRLAPPLSPQGVGTRAVDRRPHDLGTDICAQPMSSPRARRPGRARGLRGSRGRLAAAADRRRSTRRTRGRPSRRRRGKRPPPRRTSATRRRESGIACARLGDESGAVEQQQALFVPGDGEPPFEGWRQPQRHLDRRHIDEPGEQARRVAAVRRRPRPAEAPRDRERCEHGGRVQFMPHSRKRGGRR